MAAPTRPHRIRYAYCAVTVFRLDHRLVFPPPHLAEDNGLLAVGGDLSAERLRMAYSQGIFPWYDQDLPIMWHSPDPRMVLLADELYVGRSLRKSIRRAPYRVTLDTAFEEVIEACAEIDRPDQAGTWITKEMKAAYIDLHRQGHAHSVEAWLGGKLVGGLYGVSLGAAFFGESMFALEPDASKIAFAQVVAQLRLWGINLIDCQIHTEHLENFGATEWPREKFLDALDLALKSKTRLGPWRFEDAPA
jgi:leucyl/phenylalanyl-tRNA--protein transferase